MEIKQWKDENLAQFSYGILDDSGKKLILIDPARNPKQYFDYAMEHNAEIVGIIETHPHADFISSHLEIHQVTGARIYASRMVNATYPHNALDEGDTLEYGTIKLVALHTPGHSPDSITIVLEHEEKQKAVFTGDTLFIDDCGRPDLREDEGNLEEARLELAKSLYHTLRKKLLPINDDATLYPAHGAGTLCGKNLSEANSSTMGQEKKTNWSLQPMSENEFVKTLLSDQPFVPAYFPYNVEMNNKGALPFRQSVEAVKIGHPIKDKSDTDALDKTAIIIDARKEDEYKKGHLPNSINLMEGEKFETWLGSIIPPGELFYLAGKSETQLQYQIERAAAIGYEPQIKKAFVIEYTTLSEPVFDVDVFEQNKEAYTIIDVRNDSETTEAKPFRNSISIPLYELRNRLKEIPTDKPIVVHCAGGYRSAAGSSIIQSALKGQVKVFDLGESIKNFL